MTHSPTTRSRHSEMYHEQLSKPNMHRIQCNHGHSHHTHVPQRQLRKGHGYSSDYHPYHYENEHHHHYTEEDEDEDDEEEEEDDDEYYDEHRYLLQKLQNEEAEGDLSSRLNHLHVTRNCTLPSSAGRALHNFVHNESHIDELPENVQQQSNEAKKRKKKKKKKKKKGGQQNDMVNNPHTYPVDLVHPDSTHHHQQALERGNMQEQWQQPASGDIDPCYQNQDPQQRQKKKKRKKKKKKKGENQNSDKNIWQMKEKEERERIKEFWLSLDEQERRNLVRLEKEAVLKKMKEQQRHTCSCSVCGKRRTVIEEELEMLYDAYYEELENYEGDESCEGEEEYVDDEEEYDDLVTGRCNDPNCQQCMSLYPEEDAEICQNCGYQDCDGCCVERGMRQYSSRSRPSNDPGFNFAKSLTVKGGILTVADDLLKNEGKKFLEMMEKLAERRTRREEIDEEYDDGDYEEDSEEDEEMSEEQRLEEGRRMFQMFAAKMFEQRVLAAYREKVSLEKQEKLIEEEEAEERRQAELKRQKQKRQKDKEEQRKLQRQQMEEEKERKKQQQIKEEKERQEAERKKQEEFRQEQARKRQEEEKKRLAELARKEKEKEKEKENKERSTGVAKTNQNAKQPPKNPGNFVVEPKPPIPNGVSEGTGKSKKKKKKRKGRGNAHADVNSNSIPGLTAEPNTTRLRKEEPPAPKPQPSHESYDALPPTTNQRTVGNSANTASYPSHTSPSFSSHPMSASLMNTSPVLMPSNQVSLNSFQGGSLFSPVEETPAPLTIEDFPKLEATSKSSAQPKQPSMPLSSSVSKPTHSSPRKRTIPDQSANSDFASSERRSNSKGTANTLLALAPSTFESSPPESKHAETRASKLEKEAQPLPQQPQPVEKTSPGHPMTGYPGETSLISPSSSPRSPPKKKSPVSASISPSPPSVLSPSPPLSTPSPSPSSTSPAQMNGYPPVHRPLMEPVPSRSQGSSPALLDPHQSNGSNPANGTSPNGAGISGQSSSSQSSVSSQRYGANVFPGLPSVPTSDIYSMQGIPMYHPMTHHPVSSVAVPMYREGASMQYPGHSHRGAATAATSRYGHRYFPQYGPPQHSYQQLGMMSSQDPGLNYGQMGSSYGWTRQPLKAPPPGGGGHPQSQSGHPPSQSGHPSSQSGHPSSQSGQGDSPGTLPKQQQQFGNFYGQSPYMAQMGVQHPHHSKGGQAPQQSSLHSSQHSRSSSSHHQTHPSVSHGHSSQQYYRQHPQQQQKMPQHLVQHSQESGRRSPDSPEYFSSFPNNSQKDFRGFSSQAFPEGGSSSSGGSSHFHEERLQMERRPASVQERPLSPSQRGSQNPPLSPLAPARPLSPGMVGVLSGRAKSSSFEERDRHFARSPEAVQDLSLGKGSLPVGGSSGTRSPVEEDELAVDAKPGSFQPETRWRPETDGNPAAALFPNQESGGGGGGISFPASGQFGWNLFNHSGFSLGGGSDNWRGEEQQQGGSDFIGESIGDAAVASNAEKVGSGETYYREERLGSSPMEGLPQSFGGSGAVGDVGAVGSVSEAEPSLFSSPYSLFSSPNSQ